MVGLTVMAPTPTLAVLAPSIATQHRVAPTDCLHVPYRVTLSRVLNGRAAISPEMALRIEAWLGLARGGETRLWLAEQSAYDVWRAAEKFKMMPMHVQPAPAVKAEDATHA